MPHQFVLSMLADLITTVKYHCSQIHSMDNILEIVQALFNGCGVVYFSFAAFIGVLLGPVYFTIKGSYPNRSVLAFYIALSVAPSVFGFDHGAITLPALVVIPIGMRSRSLALVALSVASIFATCGFSRRESSCSVCTYFCSRNLEWQRN